jgi:hypothetical protein
VKKTLSFYMDTIERYTGDLNENDFLCYEIETDKYFALGDRVTYKGKERVIAGSTAVMKNGTLTYEYIPASEKDLKIDAGNELSIQAQEAIYMVCGSSSLTIDGITDIQGRVEMEGTVKGPVEVSGVEEEEEQEKEAVEDIQLVRQAAIKAIGTRKAGRKT